MSLIVLGLNHKSAPLALREQLAIKENALGPALRAIIDDGVAAETTILSTCHRTEIYSHLGTPRHLLHWLGRYKALDPKPLAAHFYVHQEANAVAHAMRVASGVDSMVLGEPQILGQMKSAFRKAKNVGTVGRHLDRLFQQCFRVAKSVRSQTEIGTHPISLAFASVKLAQEIFADVHKKTVLLVGLGEMSKLAYAHFHQKGVRQFIIATRDQQKAAAWLAEKPGILVPLANVREALAQSDIVLSATASTLPILGKGSVESALKARKQLPMLLIDLAMPRDIEPQVGMLDGAYLYNVDDLAHIVANNIDMRKRATMEAESIITEGTEDYMTWFLNLNQVNMLKVYRQQVQEVSANCMQKARNSLKKGVPPEMVIKQFAHHLTQKMLHAPSEFLRKNRMENLALQEVERLLGIEELL